MKYIVIGLGNYGGKLAEELTVLGHEVIGVDVREHYVDHLKDKIATAAYSGGYPFSISGDIRSVPS